MDWRLVGKEDYLLTGIVLIVSALLMALCGLLSKKCNMKWLETYAISISMLGGMVFAVLITPALA